MDRLANNYYKYITSIKKARVVDGFMPFTLAITGLASAAKPGLMGPWSIDHWPVSKSDRVLIPWPSLSGSGIKPSTYQIYPKESVEINFFDPQRPLFTPNKVFYAIRDAFDKIPQNYESAPEVIVKVIDADNPVPGALVFAEPIEGQHNPDLAVKADGKGTAWLILKEPGRYRLHAQFGTKHGETIVFLSSLDVRKLPGFSHIPRVKIELK